MSRSLYQIYSHRTSSNGYQFHLLAKGSSNPKLKKMADQLGILPFALSLAPATTAGVGNVCPFVSPGCSAVCLNYSGRGQMSNVQQARIQKTRFFFSDRNGFLELLQSDLEKCQRLARNQNKQAAVRLNVFSDIPWERLISLDDFPAVQFYDYTKAANRLGKTPKHYYLTFSLSETNETAAKQALESGYNVAAPFREKPDSYWEYPVIDGNQHDYRFLDEKPAVVALTPNPHFSPAGVARRWRRRPDKACARGPRSRTRAVRRGGRQSITQSGRMHPPSEQPAGEKCGLRAKRKKMRRALYARNAQSTQEFQPLISL